MKLFWIEVCTPSQKLSPKGKQTNSSSHCAARFRVNYGSLLTNVYTRKKVGHITQHQSRLYHTNSVILTNHRVCTLKTLNISRMNKFQDFHTDPEFPSFDAVSFKAALVVGGLVKLRKFDIVRTDRRYLNLRRRPHQFSQ